MRSSSHWLSMDMADRSPLLLGASDTSLRIKIRATGKEVLFPSVRLKNPLPIRRVRCRAARIHDFPTRPP